MDQALNGFMLPAVIAVIVLLLGFWLGRATASNGDTALAHRLAENEAAHQQALLTAANDERAALLAQATELQARCEAANTEVASLRSQLAAAALRFDDAASRHSIRHGELKADVAQATAELADARDKAAAAEVLLAELRTKLAKEAEATEAKIGLLAAVRDDMETKFRQIAADSLRQNGDEMQKTSKERLDAALIPLKQHIDHFQQELKQVHEGASKDRAVLKVELETLTRRSEEVSREAVALTRALKGDKQKQGAWGEMILANLLEKSGLRKGEEYLVQEHRISGEGDRYRPDVVVNMPGGRTLVIDSKVSLSDYEICVNAEADDVVKVARSGHITALKRHIDGLSAKAYQNMELVSVDVVVMFIPIEGALSEALRENGELTSYALERNVTIATPTTLMMALRTISSVWTAERRNQNAEEIAKRAGLLYDKVVAFSESMQAVGKHLTSAQVSYDETMNRLTRGNGNVLGQVDKLKSLGARTAKSIKIDFDEAEEDARMISNVVSLPLSDQTAG